MTGVRHIFYGLLLLFMLSACGSSDDIESTTSPDDIVPKTEQTKVSLAFSVSGNADQQTRSTADVIQQTGQVFRGLSNPKFISFQVQREVQKDDTPYPATVTDGSSQDGENAKFFFYNSLELPIGTRSMLVYAKATGINGKDKNGSTVADYPTNMAPSGITFSPDRIYSSTTVHSDATAIAEYLTDIANTTNWPENANQDLRNNFIGKGAVAPTLIAGSSASVQAYVNKLKDELQKLGNATLEAAILENINKPFPSDYPASIGLPDGVAALKWDDTNKKFVPQTATTLQGVNSMNVFAYPAELCYYGNSQLYTHDDAVSHTGYTSATKWKEDVLPNYGSSPGVVSSTTRAVAIEQPLQYGVARLDVTIKAKTATLKDGDDKDITIGDTSFPLTGIIVGGQRRVGFDYKPLNAADQQNMVYDKYVKKDDNGTAYLLSTDPAATDAVHTLLLQSLDGEDETIILEFENKCKDGENKGIAFKGMDGMINPDTKFYLIGTILKPAEETGKDYTKRVFTQDHITTANIVIESLSRAYNAVPDLYFNALTSFEIVSVDIKPWSEASSSHTVYNW